MNINGSLRVCQIRHDDSLPDPEKDYEEWLESIEFDDWTCEAAKILMCGFDVDLKSKKFGSSEVKFDLLKEGVHKKIVEMIGKDDERMLAAVVISLAARGKADIYDLNSFFHGKKAHTVVENIAFDVLNNYAAEAFAQYLDDNEPDSPDFEDYAA